MTTSGTSAFLCTYLLPIRRISTSRQEIENVSEYFRELAQVGCEVLVVDGSPAEIFAEHHRAWRDVCRHVTVDPKYTYLNGKVNGVHTGVDLAHSEYIVLADDDIRYTAGDIARARDLLGRHDMVRPQNYLSPLPCWGKTEAARMLVNRGVLRTGDYPGTCAFRRSTFLRVGHYDGDVLFDNEEIVRHFALNGADVCFALDFFVLKRPPTFHKWLEQRPRQAYEDFAMRAKTIFFMAVLPVTIALGVLLGTRAGIGFFIFLSALVVLLACRGLWRDAAYRVYPSGVVLYAPLWLVERALSVYWALYWRMVYGGYPFGDRILAKGTGRAWVAGAARVRAGALSDSH
jgi:hypothetical protein